jgi:hypothetical protein
MKIEQMYKNVLSMTLEELTVKVSADSIIRSARLQEMSKNDIPAKKTSDLGLSDAEKAMIKMLGLSMKDIKILQGGLANG